MKHHAEVTISLILNIHNHYYLSFPFVRMSIESNVIPDVAGTSDRQTYEKGTHLTGYSNLRITIIVGERRRLFAEEMEARLMKLSFHPLLGNSYATESERSQEVDSVI